MDRVLLNDGTSIKDDNDLTRFFNKLGVFYDGDFYALYLMMREIVGEGDELESARDKADEYELIADEYKQNMDGLCEECLAIADRLQSGKRGTNYTKEYLGNALRRAVSQYEI